MCDGEMEDSSPKSGKGGGDETRGRDLAPASPKTGDPTPGFGGMESQSDSAKVLDETRKVLEQHKRLLQDKDVELQAAVTQLAERDEALQERNADLEGLTKHTLSMEKNLDEKNRSLHSGTVISPSTKIPSIKSM